MTSQMADWLYYEGERYEFLGDSSKQLPMLKQLGIVSRGFTSACYRGYIAEYEIDNRLYLTKLSVRVADEKYPEIGSIKPIIATLPFPTYVGIHEPMVIDAEIVIGKDCPDNWYRSAFGSPVDYIYVLRLTLKQGMIQSISDISDEVAEIRSELQELKAEWHRQPLERENDDWRKRYSALMDRSNVLAYKLDDIGFDDD